MTTATTITTSPTDTASTTTAAEIIASGRVLARIAQASTSLLTEALAAAMATVQQDRIRPRRRRRLHRV